jgi:putative transposase
MDLFVTNIYSHVTLWPNFNWQALGGSCPSNVLDDYNREALNMEVDFSLKSSRMVWVLNYLMEKWEKPGRIRMDNGPEFIARLMAEWSQMHEIVFLYLQPGKPGN